jgi:DNA replication protein DnaC
MNLDTTLLESYLQTLRLTTFKRNYQAFAEDAAQSHLAYERCLQALAAEEVSQRELNRQRRRIKEARFPLLKELADFDFSRVPSLHAQQILDLARGAYIERAEPLIFLVGNPGLGKTHVATGLALAACRQGLRVRFYTAAQLVNTLITAQDTHQLQNVLNTALRHKLIVLDELGFIPLPKRKTRTLDQAR